MAAADQQLQAALADPIVRERIEGEFNGIRTQAAAEVEQAKTAFQQSLLQNALITLAAVNTDYPSLQGLNQEELRGALRMMPPQQAQAYLQRMAQVSTVAEGYWRQLAGQQQQQQQLQQAQIQHHQQALAQYAQAEVRRFEARTAHENPETMKHIRENSFAMLELTTASTKTGCEGWPAAQRRLT